MIEKRRVVVTGLGLVSPLGIGVDASWNAALQGKSGIGPITQFDASSLPVRIAGEVKGFDPEQYIEPKEVKKMDRFIHLAMAAATMAVEDSGLKIDEGNAERVGVIIGAGMGGLPAIERNHKAFLEKGHRRISPFFIPMVMGTCGNAGTQSATMVVRSMALGEIELSDFGRLFRRELMMGLCLGLALGLMAYFRVFIQDKNVMLGCIVAAALLATLMSANLIGALMPLVLKKINLDPALTAGPFIATIIDALGIAIYFEIAFVLMRIF